jgi:hypothetical protein
LNLTRKGKKALTDKGFVPLAYTPGVMIAYATAPGQTAADTGGGGGPYAKALADEIVKPGIEAMTMFRRVALRVNREIGQDLWIANLDGCENHVNRLPSPLRRCRYPRRWIGSYGLFCPSHCPQALCGACSRWERTPPQL